LVLVAAIAAWRFRMLKSLKSPLVTLAAGALLLGSAGAALAQNGTIGSTATHSVVIADRATELNDPGDVNEVEDVNEPADTTEVAAPATDVAAPAAPATEVEDMNEPADATEADDKDTDTDTDTEDTATTGATGAQQNGQSGHQGEQEGDNSD